jgi:hypothetical protein
LRFHKELWREIGRLSHRGCSDAPTVLLMERRATRPFGELIQLKM